MYLFNYNSSTAEHKLDWKKDGFCEISSSHGGEYEAQNLLGCTAVFLI
jgi:hypothetical protein